jgi:hypothetical protein
MAGHEVTEAKLEPGVIAPGETLDGVQRLKVKAFGRFYRFLKT